MPERKLVTIRIVSEILPIEGADRIELAKIDGWQCVISKGDFNVGDTGIYFEIDSFLPIQERYEFLRKSCYKKMADGREGFRIKTMKLRKVLSQGLLMPISKFPEFTTSVLPYDVDLAVDLHVVKYEPPIPTQLAGLVKGQFPSFIPKTDEERVQNLQEVLTANNGTSCYISEKVDGTSVTYYLKDGEFGVCSRNLELKETDGNTLWRVARELMIEEKLRAEGLNVALQGELIGEGINGNSLKMLGNRILFFNVFDITQQKYLDWNAAAQFLGKLGLETVPILECPFELTDNIDVLLEKAKGSSNINTEVLREGIVIRPIFEKQYNGERLSMKAINNDYLLKVEQ